MDYTPTDGPDEQKEASDSLNLLTNDLIIAWLGIKYVDRTFFDEIANEASIRRMREILDEAKDEEEPTSC
jgi:hypothetical protein